MVDLTQAQKDVLAAEGHQLVVGGPGSGKTTVSILKAAKIAREKLRPGQRILFLSFARATVSRVFEAIDAVDALDIDPADAAPDHWRHVHNRLAAQESPRPYTLERHHAWLARKGALQ